jgi:hypothetical protein
MYVFKSYCLYYHFWENKWLPGRRFFFFCSISTEWNVVFFMPSQFTLCAQSRKKLWFIIWQTAHGSAQYPSPSAIKAMPSHIYKGKRSLSALVEPPSQSALILCALSLRTYGSRITEEIFKETSTNIIFSLSMGFICLLLREQHWCECIGSKSSRSAAFLCWRSAKRRKLWWNEHLANSLSARSTSPANWSCKMHLTGEKNNFLLLLPTFVMDIHEEACE